MESEKIETIVDFVSEHPESQAGRAICRRLLGSGQYEFNEELTGELRDRLNNIEDEEQLELFYYMVK